MPVMKSLSSTNTSQASVPNFNFFSLDNLPAGDHTLFVDITEVIGEQSLMIDYITFDFTPRPTPTVSSFLTPTSTSSLPVALDRQRSVLVAGIIGAICGLVSLLILLFYLLYWKLRRRRSPKPADLTVTPMSPPRSPRIPTAFTSSKTRVSEPMETQSPPPYQEDSSVALIEHSGIGIPGRLYIVNKV